MSPLWTWVSAIALFALTWGAPAHAEEHAAPPLSLSWIAPEGCPSARSVEEDVARLVADAKPREPLAAQVTVSHEARGGWRASLRTESAGNIGERRLASESCASLASAVGLVLALILDPDLLTEEPRPGLRPAPPPPPPAYPPASPTHDEPRPAPAPPLAFAVAASGLVDVGTLPGVTVGGGIAAAIARRPFSVEVLGEIFPTASGTANALALAGARFQLLDVGGRACGRAGSVWSVGGCVGGDWEHVQADGFGVNAPGSATRTWGAARGGGEVGWQPRGWFRLLLRLEAIVPLARDTFAIENVGTIYRPAIVAGRCSLGAQLIF